MNPRAGSIVRVEVQDFMAYEHAELEPLGTGLNLIVGCNGSGKSSLLNAICIGLGGHPRLLGRAKEIQSFVKNGRHRARIEIVLHDPERGDVNIVRVISKSEGGKNFSSISSSKWRVNGQVSNEKKVRKMLKIRYGIQVENLCQILPQDKVSMFSRLNPQQMLTETIRAALGDAYVERQDQLAEMQKKISLFATTAENEKEDLQRKKGEAERMQDRVRRQKERKAALERFQLCKKRKIQVDIMDLKKLSQDMKQELEGAAKAHAERIAQLQDLSAKRNKVSEENADLQKKFSVEKFLQNRSRAELTIPNAAQDHAQLVKVLDRCSDELLDVVGEHQSRSEKLEKAKHNLQNAKSAWEMWKSDNNVEILRKNAARLQSESKAFRDEERKVGRDFTEIEETFQTERNREGRLLQALDRLKKSFSSKESVLRKINNKIVAQAWNVVQGRVSAKQVAGNVYMPVLEIRPRDQFVASMLERCVSLDKLTTLVCDNQADSRTWVMKIRSMDSLYVPPDAPEPRRRIDKRTLGEYHLLGYLDELINAPLVVLQALRDIGNIDNILVGTEETEKALLDMDDDLRSNIFVGFQIQTPRTSFRIRRSRHGSRNFITNTVSYNRLIPARIFQHSRAADEETRKMEDLELKINETREEMEALESQRQKLSKAKENLKSKRNAIDDARTKAVKSLEFGENKKRAIKLAEDELWRIIAQFEDENGEAALKRVLLQASKALNTIPKKVSDMVSKLETGAKACDKIGQVMLKTAESRRKLEDADRAVHHVQNRLQILTKRINALRAERDKNRQQRKNMLEKLGSISPEEEDKLSELPTSNAEVDGLLVTLKTRIDSIVPDETIVKRYETLLEAIEELEPRVVDQQQRQEDSANEFNTELQKWSDAVERLIENINTKFCEAFSYVQKQGYECSGSVSLEKHEFDPRKFGVDVKVRFRKDEEERSLDIHVQSGGERSLTTFMYLLSLNEISRVPFRVVDEINQGMDEEKERISMHHLFNNACHPEKGGQYFLITPKLLTGLPYNPNVKIHVVFNGTGALPQKLASIKAFLAKGGRKRRALQENATGSIKSKRMRPSVAGKENSLRNGEENYDNHDDVDPPQNSSS